MKPSDLIIDRPDLQPPVQRNVFRLLTLLAWTLYGYLWLPVVTLAAWWVGARLGFEELSQSPTPYIDVDLFIVLGVAAVVAIVLLVGWAEYNRLRFQGNERRGPRPMVTPEETAAALGVGAAVAARLRQARHATLVLDEHAVGVAVRNHGPGEPDPPR